MRVQRPNDPAAAEVVSSSSSSSTAVVPSAGDDSGYSTESSNNNASGDPSSTDTTGTGNNTTSSSSSDPDSSSNSDPFFTEDDDYYDFEGDNVQERIEYIREKQQILQRASGVLLYDDEETYNAATARESSRTPQELQDELKHQDECTIWGEAKDVLRQISSTTKEAAETMDTIVTKTSSGGGGNMGGGRVGGSINPVKRSAAAMTSTFLHHATSRGEINLTSVNHVASLSYDKHDAPEETNSAEQELQQQQLLLAQLPTVTFGKGQWMAQALVRMSSSSSSSQRKEATVEDSDSSTSNNNSSNSTNSDSSSSSTSIINPQDCRWKVISDPFTCSLGLVPPSNISIQNAVNIEEAIAFTSEARLVTQATPPFCVVFVNKAFLLLAGLSSKESLIGKPVESILMVPQDFLHPHVEDNTTTNNNNNSNVGGSSDSCSLHCILSSSLSGTADNVNNNRVACRMQVVPVLDRFRRRRLSMSSYSCMSHLMIRVHDTRKKVVTIAEVLPMERRNKIVRHAHNNNLPQQQQQNGGGNHRGGGSGDKLLGTVG